MTGFTESQRNEALRKRGDKRADRKTGAKIR
jgi:hypothetical protein